MAVRTFRSVSGAKLRRQVHTTGATSINCKKPVGGMNEGCYTLGDLVFGIQTAKIKSRNIKNAKREKRRVFLADTHQFQLWRGDTRFGAPKTMTGQEAADLNRQFERKFMDDKSANARLWRWHLKDYEPLPKGMTVAQYRQRRFERSLAPA